MIGTNILKLNGATMVAAVQSWLNSQVMQENLTVESVTYNGGDFTFDVAVKPFEPPTPRLKV